MDDLALVYATFPDVATAESIGERLIRARLAACINVLPGVSSIFIWEGAVERSQEAAAIIKTRRSSWEAVRAFVKEAHPYDTPVIVMIGIDAVDEGTKRWLLETIPPRP